MYIILNNLYSSDNYLSHHGILGQKWGVRRFQNSDGTRTKVGLKREHGERIIKAPMNSDSYKQERNKKIKTGLKIAGAILATGATAYALNSARKISPKYIAGRNKLFDTRRLRGLGIEDRTRYYIENGRVKHRSAPSGKISDATRAIIEANLDYKIKQLSAIYDY